MQYTPLNLKIVIIFNQYIKIDLLQYDLSLSRTLFIVHCCGSIDCRVSEDYQKAGIYLVMHNLL